MDELKVGYWRQETVLDTLTVIQIKYRLDQVLKCRGRYVTSSVRPSTVSKLETFMPPSIPHHYVLPQPSFCIIFTTICNNFWFTHLSHFYHLRHQGSPRILELVANPFSRGSSQPRNQTQDSCIAGGFFTNWAKREAHTKKDLNEADNHYGVITHLEPDILKWEVK